MIAGVRNVLAAGLAHEITNLFAQSQSSTIRMRRMIAGVRNVFAAGLAHEIANLLAQSQPSTIRMRKMIAGVRNALAAGLARKLQFIFSTLKKVVGKTKQMCYDISKR